MLMCLFRGLPDYNEEEERQLVLSNRLEVVESLRCGLRSHSRQITISFTAQTDVLGQMDTLVEELFSEALEETEEPCEGDYIRFQCGGHETRVRRTRRAEGYDYTVQIVPDYYTYLVQEEQVDKWIDEIIFSFNFNNKTSKNEMISDIYNFVYDTVSYDEVHKNKPNQHLKTTAYAALKYHTAVCQGYAVLMYRLLREAGVRTRVVTGEAVLPSGERERHAWNIVELDGYFYNLDVTWDKAMETDGYFMKSDEDFSNHVRDEEYRTAEFYLSYPMSAESLPVGRGELAGGERKAGDN